MPVPVVEADSIRGREKAESSRYYSDPVLAIPLNQVSTFEGAHGLAAKSVGVTVLVFAGLFAVAAVLVVIACC